MHFLIGDPFKRWLDTLLLLGAPSSQAHLFFIDLPFEDDRHYGTWTRYYAVLSRMTANP